MKKLILNLLDFIKYLCHLENYRYSQKYEHYYK
jgi:hypothetical protein